MRKGDYPVQPKATGKSRRHTAISQDSGYSSKLGKNDPSGSHNSQEGDF